MPSNTKHVYLVNPVRIGGTEREGAAPAFVVDATRQIPVVVIGNAPPQVGQILPALAVGGRWVAESGGSTPSLNCSPCNLPRQNLTISWKNNLVGNGSAALAFVPPGQWISACANQLVFSLLCPGRGTQFNVTYFLSGTCPGGQSQSCTSPGSDPFGLLLSSYSCSPFLLQYSINSNICPVLWANGYSTFTITQ